MCGIWAFIKNDNSLLNFYDYFMNIKHRGPDSSVYLTIKNTYIGFHRLGILETSLSGNQPFYLNNSVLICNGEIYNYKELIQKYNLNITNNCDCLVLLHLYKKLSQDDFINVLKNDIKAEYSFIIFDFDEKNNLTKIIASRDHVGVRPLYISNLYNNIIFSSELKGIPTSYLENVKEFPCGHLYINDIPNNDIKYINYTTIYDIINLNDDIKDDLDIYLSDIRNSLITAVKRRLITDDNINIGYYLSGGLDSSLLCAIAAKLQPNKKIKTFSIGFQDSTDLPYAKKVADFIGSDHTEVIISHKDALDIINDVIYATCTYDITTIRASCGQYLLSKYIKENTDIKVIINGDGSDEVLGGYLFNFNAPNPKSFDDSCKDLVKKIHMYDGRRLDRCLAYFGLEARVPFLDIDFIKVIWNIPAYLRMPSYKNCEKYLLRKAFEGYLDNDCLFRTKEAFSDGISSNKNSFFKIIQDNLKDFPIFDNCPTSESSYYKFKFTNYFNNKCYSILPHYWKPNFQNSDNNYIDPSARVLDIYSNLKNKE
jgi:asparagine synthase (glutamine-hydrolysing)